MNASPMMVQGNFSKFLLVLVCSAVNWKFVFCAVESTTNGLELSNTNNSNRTDYLRIERDWLIPRELTLVNKIVQFLVTEKCRNDTKIVIDGVRNHEKWAIQMVDSFSKSPTGLLYGNYYQLGNFDECVRTRQWENSPDPIRGQYCLADIDILRYKNKDSGSRIARSATSLEMKRSRNDFNGTIHWSICIPSSCTTKDGEIFINEIFNELREYLQVKVNVNSNKCYYQDEPEQLSTLELIYGVVIGGYLVFIIIATGVHLNVMYKKPSSYDVATSTQEKKNRLITDIMLCFSLLRIIQKFGYTGSSDKNIGCISALRVISMWFIIMGHCLLHILGGPLFNTNFFVEASVKSWNAIFTNNTILVDNFLLISGFLKAFLLIPELEKQKGKVNFGLMYVIRYIRLTPVYLVVIGFYCTFLYRIGEGPLWKATMLREQERCMHSWWLNLIYVNNYVSTDKLCMFQSWFLAVDFHLFIIAPFVVYAIWKRKVLGLTLLGFWFLASIVTVSLFTYTEKLDPTLLSFPPEVEDVSVNAFFNSAYIKTHMRTSSYVIGLLVGYIVYRVQQSSVKLSSLVVWFGSIIAVLLALTSLLSIVIFFDPNHEVSIFGNVVYASLHRICWTFAIGWLIAMCVTGNAEMLNKYLSSKIFLISGRLTYSAYLVNGAVVLYFMGSLRQPYHLSYIELFSTSLGVIFLSSFFAFVLYILIESPIIGLEKMLLKREKDK